MKNLFLLPLICLLFACGSNEDETTVDIEHPSNEAPKIAIDLNDFEGNYLLAEKDGDETVLVENCWSKTVEQFEIAEFAGSPGEYFFVFNGHYATMYLMESAELNENTLSFTGVLEDESSDQVFSFTLTKNEDGSLSLEGESSNYALIKESEKGEYKLIPCNKRRELSDLDYMNEIFMAFFALEKGGEALSAYIPEEGIELILPGSGVSPVEQTVHSADEIVATNLFNTPAYNRLMEYVQMHNNEERAFLEFVDALPDRCMPGSEALFVKSTTIEDYKNPLLATAMLTKVNDEQGETYTYVIVHLEFDDRMIIKKIDATECGA